MNRKQAFKKMFQEINQNTTIPIEWEAISAIDSEIRKDLTWTELAIYNLTFLTTYRMYCWSTPK